MENDLISRQAAIEKINERQRKLIYCFGFENDMVKTMDIAKSIITSISPAQLERKKGKWIEEEKGIHVTSYRCSECGRTVMDDTGYDVSADYPFCNCGADMRGEQDETA